MKPVARFRHPGLELGFSLKCAGMWGLAPRCALVGVTG
jgi:hypothetical protein